MAHDAEADGDGTDPTASDREQDDRTIHAVMVVASCHAHSLTLTSSSIATLRRLCGGPLVLRYQRAMDVWKYITKVRRYQRMVP